MFSISFTFLDKWGMFLSRPSSRPGYIFQSSYYLPEQALPISNHNTVKIEGLHPINMTEKTPNNNKEPWSLFENHYWIWKMFHQSGASSVHTVGSFPPLATYLIALLRMRSWTCLQTGLVLKSFHSSLCQPITLQKNQMKLKTGN